VSEKKAKAWCGAKGNIPHYETSAKDDVNVEPAFGCIARHALRNEPEEDLCVAACVRAFPAARVLVCGFVRACAPCGRADGSGSGTRTRTGH
jgi:hypothetical protein